MKNTADAFFCASRCARRICWAIRFCCLGHWIDLNGGMETPKNCIKNIEGNVSLVHNFSSNVEFQHFSPNSDLDIYNTLKFLEVELSLKI